MCNVVVSIVMCRIYGCYESISHLREERNKVSKLSSDRVIHRDFHSSSCFRFFSVSSVSSFCGLFCAVVVCDCLLVLHVECCSDVVVSAELCQELVTVTARVDLNTTLQLRERLNHGTRS